MQTQLNWEKLEASDGGGVGGVVQQMTTGRLQQRQRGTLLSLIYQIHRKGQLLNPLPLILAPSIGVGVG